MSSEAIGATWTGTWGGERELSLSEQVVRERMERDAARVEHCLNGSDGAWEALVRDHTRLVYGACYRFTGRADEARDLTQDVFLRVFKSLHTFNPASGGFRTWLMKLTRNLLIDHYRRNRKHQVVDSLEEQTTGVEHKSDLRARADHALAGREASELIQAGLEQLSPELREAVILRDLQGMEYREIGDTLEVPEGTVKSRINRGRRELARRLKAMGVTA